MRTLRIATAVLAFTTALSPLTTKAQTVKKLTLPYTRDVTWNMIGGNQDRFIGLDPELGEIFLNDPSIWKKPTNPNWEIYLVRPSDRGFGRRFNQNDFRRLIIDKEGWSTCPRWLIAQLYCDIHEQESVLWFCETTTPYTTSRGRRASGVPCIGKNGDKTHDLFWGEATVESSNDLIWVFGRPKKK